jgi:hypothetical protein
MGPSWWATRPTERVQVLPARTTATWSWPCDVAARTMLVDRGRELLARIAPQTLATTEYPSFTSPL